MKKRLFKNKSLLSLQEAKTSWDLSFFITKLAT